MNYDKSSLDLWKKEIAPTISDGYIKWIKSKSEKAAQIKKQFVTLKRHHVLSQFENHNSQATIYPFPTDNILVIGHYLSQMLKTPISKDQLLKFWTNPKATSAQKRLAFSAATLAFYPTESIWKINVTDKRYFGNNVIEFEAALQLEGHRIWDFSLYVSSQKSETETINLPSWNLFLEFVDWSQLPDPDLSDLPPGAKHKMLSGEEIDYGLIRKMFSLLPLVKSQLKINEAALQANFPELVISAIWYAIGKGESGPLTPEQLVDHMVFLAQTAMQATGYILMRFPEYLDTELRQGMRNKAVSNMFYRMLWELYNRYRRYKVGMVETSSDPSYMANAYATLEDGVPLFRVSALAAAMKYGAMLGMTWIPLDKMIMFFFLHEQYHAYRDDLEYYQKFIQRRYTDPETKDDDLFDISKYPEVAQYSGNFIPSAMNIEFDQQFQETVETVIFSGLPSDQRKQASQALRLIHIFRSYTSGGQYSQIWSSRSESDSEKIKFSLENLQSGDPQFSRKTSLADLVVFWENGGLDQESLRNVAMQLWIKPIFANLLWIAEKVCREKGTWVRVEIPER